MPYSLSTQIEIVASPADVKSVFLDFAKYPEWSKAFLKSIEVTKGDKSNPKVGDKLKVVAGTMTFTPTVTTSTDTHFKWRGSLFGLFNGEHSFRFDPSTATPGSTTLTHSEDFSGVLSFIAKPDASTGKKTLAGFDAYNNEIKARVEGLEKPTPTAAPDAAAEPATATATASAPEPAAQPVPAAATASETAPAPAPAPATSEMTPVAAA